MKLIYDKQGRALVVSDDFEGEATAASDTQTTSTGTPLPEGFPAQAALIASGLDTLEAVQKWLDDPDRPKIPSVGDKTLEQIQSALAKLGE